MSKPILPDYNQQFLFPPSVEDWVAPDHPVRFLKEFVEQLDLEELGIELPAGETGRPAYHPSLLLRVWLYGYYQKIRTSRKLEMACREHMSLVWLTGMNSPDHNSLWRFWKANKKVMKALFKQTVKVAMKTGAVGLVMQAVDGTKIEAVASGYSGWTQEYMQKVLEALDAELDEIEKKIENENQDSDQGGYRLPEELQDKENLREQVRQGLEELKKSGRKHYHPKEPDAHRMKSSGKTTRYAYNAQAVADEKEGIIVACEANDKETDNGQLTPMIEQAQENTGVSNEVLTLADSGYGAGADIKEAAEADQNVLVTPLEGNQSKDNPYASRYFLYQPKDESVTCPVGKTLDFEGNREKRGRHLKRYRCHNKDCPVRDQCTKDKKGRIVEIWTHTPHVQAMRERLKDPENIARFKKRGQIIERRFAQLKQHDGFRRWTVRGKENVDAQWALLCTTLNLRILYKAWQKKVNGNGPGKGPIKGLKALNPSFNPFSWLWVRLRTLRESIFANRSGLIFS